jgi:LPPG:FO 2-phospho-L-lactate transferase
VRTCRAPVVAVSPLVGGQALKGPTAKIMQELGLPLSALTVAAHYRDLLDGFIVDQCDVDLVPDIEALGMSARAAPSVMLTLDDRINLAHTAVDFVSTLPR